MFDTTAGTLRMTGEDDAGVSTSEATVQISGATMNWQFLCPTQTLFTGVQYMATSTSLDWYDAFGKVVATFTKQ